MINYNFPDNLPTIILSLLSLFVTRISGAVRHDQTSDSVAGTTSNSNYSK